jgi:hypothetical protein
MCCRPRRESAQPPTTRTTCGHANGPRTESRDRRNRTRTSVPADPPSRTDLLTTTGRSSDSRVCATAAFSEMPAGHCPRTSQWLERSRTGSPGRGAARIQRRGRPGIAPEFPVCPEKPTGFLGPPATLAESNGHGRGVNQRDVGSVTGTGFQRASNDGKVCGSRSVAPRICTGCDAASRTIYPRGTNVNPDPMRTRKSCSEKYLDSLKPLSPARR